MTRPRRPEFAALNASQWLRQLEERPPRSPTALAGAWLIGAAAIDYATGPTAIVAFLYLPAVAGLGWLAGHRAGALAGAAAALAGLFADWPVGGGAPGGLALWNALALGALLGGAGFLAGEVRRQRDELRWATLVDGLTGLRNRSAFLVALEDEVARAQRFGGETSLLCIDVDGFKRVNEQHGHAAGDRLLKALAAELGVQVRRTDLVARLGGDEFAILLTATGPQAAQTVALKLQAALVAWAARERWPVGFSIGWASAPVGGGLGAEQLLARADATLYDGRRRRGDDGSAAAGGPLAGSTAPA